MFGARGGAAQIQQNVEIIGARGEGGHERCLGAIIVADPRASNPVQGKQARIAIDLFAQRLELGHGGRLVTRPVQSFGAQQTSRRIGVV